jgi:hypothetical protein
MLQISQKILRVPFLNMGKASERHFIRFVNIERFVSWVVRPSGGNAAGKLAGDGLMQLSSFFFFFKLTFYLVSSLLTFMQMFVFSCQPPRVAEIRGSALTAAFETGASFDAIFDPNAHTYEMQALALTRAPWFICIFLQSD